MTYKLVSHESGKYTIEFDDGGCRPATDVEVALFKQRDELLAAIRCVLDDAEECQDSDDWMAMLVSLEAFHNLDSAYDDAIASVKEKNCG